MSLKHHLPQYTPTILILACIILSCGIVSQEKTDETFSFNKSYDELTRFDSVAITLRDTTGKTIDVLYRGKVDSIREIENRAAPHWNGTGIVVVSILGYQDGDLVYHVDKTLDGKTNQVLDTVRIILPGTVISTGSLELNLTDGDSIPFPTFAVTPPELSDKSISLTSSAPQVLKVGSNGLVALHRGVAKLTATLKSNPTKSLVLNVTILPNPLIPDSISLSSDTLRLAAEGRSGFLSVRVAPMSADPTVIWSIRDTSLGRVVDGTVQALKSGIIVVMATRPGANRPYPIAPSCRSPPPWL